LVIEDDEFITMVYADQLSDVPNIEFKLDAYTTFGAGVAALEKGNYDALLLDLNLPDSDYTNTIERMEGFSNRLPIIIMTSTIDEHLALKTMNRGGQDYLVKSNLERPLFIRSILYSIERHHLRTLLETEKEKSDQLLRNILPQSIAEELKADGSIKARHYNTVSVMFIDFAQFTSITAHMEPSQLVEELHECFSYFDEVVEKHGLEKIKTIGDAYMCAGGIPSENDSHLSDMIWAALDICTYIEAKYKAKASANIPYWRARIGLHAGPAIAGVVGSKKFQYDIWGDTVNTASRMESNGMEGKVNVSDAFYKLLKENPEFTFENRGKIEVKGKGAMEMYFVR
jgi:class 3 adenylate cyclase